MYIIAVLEARVHDVTFPTSNDHAFNQGEDYQGNIIWRLPSDDLSTSKFVLLTRSRRPASAAFHQEGFAWIKGGNAHS
jgi:hypothetical protein